jgi:shikimate 5-dehydrogenase
MRFHPRPIFWSMPPSVGRAPRVDERLDLDMNTVSSHLVVCDVIMNPPQTNLLRTAASHGATVLDGRGMLVNQAARNIWHWPGVRVDTAVLRSTLDRALQN